MSEQHYGRAPCGCERMKPWPNWVETNITCSEHRCGHERDPVSGGHFCAAPFPWHAASALEAGLRAIAGWPYSEQLVSITAFNRALGYWLDDAGRRRRCTASSWCKDGHHHADCPAHDSADCTHHINCRVYRDLPLDLGPQQAKLLLANQDHGWLTAEAKERLEAIAAATRIESSDTERPEKSLAEKAADIERVYDDLKERAMNDGKRVTCYWDGAPLVDGRCSKCGNEQPPREG